ncbi:MAG: hypothetical protein ACK5PR_02745, partial [bacterium]
MAICVKFRSLANIAYGLWNSYRPSRAHWIFEKRNRLGFDLESRPTPTPKKWYEREDAFLNVFQEYLK